MLTLVLWLSFHFLGCGASRESTPDVTYANGRFGYSVGLPRVQSLTEADNGDGATFDVEGFPGVTGFVWASYDVFDAEDASGLEALYRELAPRSVIRRVGGALPRIAVTEERDGRCLREVVTLKQGVLYTVAVATEPGRGDRGLLDELERNLRTP
jgi:hypothetical protein